MALVSPEIIDGQLTLDRDGYHDTKVFRVTDLLSLDVTQKKFEALHASGLPVMFEAHPAAPDCKALKISADAVSADYCLVTVEYGPAAFAGAVDGQIDDTAPPQIETGITANTRETNQDVNKNPLTVDYTVTDETTGETTTSTHVATVEKYVPQEVLRYSRRESQNPTLKAREFTGTINQFPIGIYLARELLCLGITGRSPDGGASFDVEYIFQRAEPGETWDVDLIFRDDEGNIPADVGDGNGISRGHRIYKETDFSRLGI